ncbi:multicopper oxidase domain-containing protein [Brachybacterium sp. p3-SID1565]|nr:MULTISPECIES: multicopper oxidase domain-containing protein [unclassified Brachybacterium]MCT1384818.1 multicopper oxidase domain-containing protein [Brachybacterium sp. p3-SID1565]MCT1774821.1 multicopper oxidase domain-containing protein [Brachybacterium sp. p3-SID957]
MPDATKHPTPTLSGSPAPLPGGHGGLGGSGDPGDSGGSGGSGSGGAREPGRPDPRSSGRRSWHRRASRPVSWWMIALVVVVLTHQWLPQARWLMVHMVTLGLISTSIMVWGQHFTEALLKTRLGEESRPRQVARSYLLTAGVAVTIAGMLPSWPWVVVVGALLVSAALVWYAISLGSQVRAALAPRFAFTVRAYIGAACLLPAGAVLGAVMAFSPGEPWQGRLLLAHQILNILGFVGITVTGTLLTLWPTVLRTKADPVATARSARGLVGMGVGVVGASIAAIIASVSLGVAFVLVYAGSFAWVAITLVRAGIRSARQEHRIELPWFPILSIGAGMVWFMLGLLRLTALWWRSADEQLASSLVAADVQTLTVPFVAGFLLQVLLGAMSYLLPVTMGGGPRAVRASLAMMSRFAVVRVVIVNLVIALFVLADKGTAASGALFAGLTVGTTDAAGFGSWARVLASLLAFAALLSFLVLMVLAIRVSVRERKALMASGGPGGPDASAPLPSPALRGATDPSASTATTGAASPSAPGSGTDPSAPAGLDRRALTGALLGAGSVLGVTAVGSSLDRAYGSYGDTGAASGSGGTAAPAAGGAVSPTGQTTTVAVSMAEMRFHPDVIEVPAGNDLVIELANDDPHDVHDLVLADGTASGRLQPGDSTTVEAGVISHDLAGWCSIVGHRAMGMTLRVTAVGAATTGHAHGGSAGASTGGDELARVPMDLAAEPGEGYAVRDAAMPPSAGQDQRLTLEITEAALEVAPGVSMDAMTFNGTVVGPVIRSELGARLTVDLVNNGSMGHSLDLHAGRVAPDEVMRTIPPGKSLEYTITTDYAGAWLYHCSTMPMTVHLAAGLLGVLIVPPQDLATADREYVLVQSDHYLVPEGAAGHAEAMHEGAHPVSPAKIAAERPDMTVFNGHANQYVHAPLEARVGERVRIWVLAAGPSRGISFHVVGGVFDTVFFEGEYLLRPDNETGGGSQALHLGAAQGGFVELVFDEPGTYTAVNHSFVDMERGARALIRVTT